MSLKEATKDQSKGEKKVEKKDYSNAKDGTQVIATDEWLAPYENELKARFAKYQSVKNQIVQAEGSLSEFAEGYKKFGFNRVKENGVDGIMLREWAPGAKQMFLFGEFNGWNRWSHEAKRDQYGVHSLFLPDVNGKPAIQHKTKVKLNMVTQDGRHIERIPAWIKVVWQENKNPFYDAVYWNPPQKYEWKHKRPQSPKDIRIYECHVGMSSKDPKCSTYIEFKDTVIPEIIDAGYNAIQIMGIMEHAYYASFGYQVTSFFAASSRFGTPEELKELVDEAHRQGLVVLLDLVHSHASRNVDDGLNQYDGTDHCYFHEGKKGEHPLWDSKLFNYSSYEVLRFLLSNAKWWLDEYHFDGFRFDAITSMIYQHHGVAHSFVDGYKEYFDPTQTDEDAIVYLTLVNEMVHSLSKDPFGVITIAEDVSGFATIAKPVESGGVGFNYRLHMAVPDKWIKLLKNTKDEDWGMQDLCWELKNRRWMEPTIAYAESHDQALVGDKTIAFWLMDKEMYTSMSTLGEYNPIVARGIALHKMIRLITSALAGEGYLNFMGNEFGHPEWIDFPREGNNDSFDHARRRWDLKHDQLLRYHHLFNFDKAMNAAEDKYKWLPAPQAYITVQDDGDKIIAFERAGLLFVFNFHSTKSFTDYSIGVSKAGKWKIVLSTDDKEFGGFENVERSIDYFSQPVASGNWPQRLMLYIPSRTAFVFAVDE
eukprot:TRINITY_DN2107_c0_g1_i1.p1 TRINITY_DN2107_c0_g1~~TRINITY_DN2107_c0_g1_i1.p1  ORF type:complete len:706 (+),score=290.42 TRINITY_DN2107_c0_g1_i1:246-2363(+)